MTATNNHEPITGADVLAAQLAIAGVTRAYGISGQRILPLFRALNEFGIAITLTRHEQGAAYMADTHARVTGGLGVVVTTSGPGAINALGGAASAWMDSVPVLIVTAQAELGEFGRYGIQEGTGRGRTPAVQAMFEATTKGSWQPAEPNDVASMVAKAIRRAVSGRPGPVHVDVPSDLFTAEVTEDPGQHLVPFEPPGGPPPASEQVTAALGAIRRATRPLILAGGGLGSPATAQRLLELAERLDVPVAGTFAAKRFLNEDHPLVLGPVGVFGRAAANAALHREADLIVAIGVTFSYLSSAGWPTLPPERLIRVDIDRRELTTNYVAAISINSSSAAFVGALTLEAGDLTSLGSGAARVAELRRRHIDDEMDPGATARPLHPVAVCEAVNRVLDERTTVIADVGQNAYWAERYLRTRGDNRFVINAGLGAMGHAVAGALGALLARRDAQGDAERVVVTTGDGGFLMSGLEVSSAVAEDAAITWVIFNNGTLGTQSAWWRRQGLVPVAADLPQTDFVGLAWSLGADGRQINTRDELDEALAWAVARRRPTVLDVVIDTEPAPRPFVVTDLAEQATSEREA